MKELLYEIKPSLLIQRYFNASLYVKTKLKLYFSVFRPVDTHACETWILKEK